MRYLAQKSILALTVCLFGLLAAGLSSCSGSDESSEGGTSKLAQQLSGTKWIYRNADFTESSSGDRAWLDYETVTIYFTSTSEGVCVYSTKSYDTDLPTTRSTDWEFFTYTTSGSNVTVNGEKNSFTVAKQGNYLTASGGSVVYEGKSMTSTDWQYVESLKPITGSCGDNLTYSYDKRTYWLTIKGEGDMYNYSSGRQLWTSSNNPIAGITIEEGVTSIGAYAFKGVVADFDDFDFPRSLKKIGAYAFSGSLISEVYLYNVVEIGEGAFADCSYLKKISLNDEIETIGSYAFNGVSIKKSSFSLPKNLKSVGDFAFSHMTMGTLTLNDQLQTIGHGVFSGVKNTTLTIPNSVKSIGSAAFDGNFTKIIIGTGLETLYSGAFIGTSSGGSMYVNLGNPIDVVNSSSVTDNDSKWTLYVPKGSKTAYKNKAPWKNFKAINEDSSLESGNGEPENSGTESGTEETTGKTQGHDWVDLGLPSGTKWATCNVGASSVTETGDYYPWGCTSSESDTPNTYSYVPDNICGNNRYDAATYVWGSSWQTPSLQQLQELCDNCTFTKAKVSGKRVIKVTSKKNKAVIYLPLTGYKKGFYERTTTTFSSYSTSTVYLMCGEITERDGYVAAKNYKFACSYDDLNASCSSWFNLSSAIYSYVYKIPIRPVTK